MEAPRAPASTGLEDWAGDAVAKMLRQNPKALETLTAAIRELDGKQVAIGWFADAVYPDGTRVAEIAAVQELGSPSKNIPPRLGMRATAIQKWPEWKEIMLKGAQAILKGNWTASQVMDAVGAKAAGDIAKHIAEVWSPPLKPKTILARARRYAKRVRGKPLITASLQKPLVDSGRLISSITHSVEDSR